MQRTLLHDIYHRDQYAMISSMQNTSCDVEHATGEASLTTSIKKATLKAKVEGGL